MINLEDYNKPAAGTGQGTERTQTWETDAIREKLLLIQNLILSPLTQMGYGPSTGLWKKCIIFSQPLSLSVSALLEMADGKLEPLGGLNPNIPPLFSQIREEMYTQAPYEGAWLSCEFTINSKEGEEPALLFEYDDPQKIPGLISDREKLNAEFKQFPRSESFTPLWWQIMLTQPIPYLSLPGEEKEESEIEKEVEEIDITSKEPVLPRSQTWQTDSIRQKLLLLQNHILAPLTQGGYGPGSGHWKKCTIYGFPINQRGVVMLDMADGKQEYLNLDGNTVMGLGMMFNQIREEMYAQVPYEGSWLTCEYIIDSQDIDSPRFITEYDKKEGFPDSMCDNKGVKNEFQKFPRGKYFTPEWWQEMLDYSVEYLPVPEGIIPDPNAEAIKHTEEIKSYIEKLRQDLQHIPEGILHLPERIQLYWKTGDPNTINKVFLECAKKVFPFWKERFPEDKKLPEILRTIHTYLYDNAEQGIDEKAIKNAYKELASVCMPCYNRSEELNRLIDSVEIDPADLNKAFNVIYEYLDKEDRHFFTFLDAGMDTVDVELILKATLEKNFNISIPLPDMEQYSECVLDEVYEEVADDYKKALNTGGYDLILANTDPESYVLIVYPLTQKQQVKKALINTGFGIWNGDDGEEDYESTKWYDLYEEARKHVESLTGKAEEAELAFSAGYTLVRTAFSIYAGAEEVLNPEEYHGEDDTDRDGEKLLTDYGAFITETNDIKDPEKSRIYWMWFLDTAANLADDNQYATPIHIADKKRKGSTEEILFYIENLKQGIHKDPHHTLHLPERIALYQQIEEPELINKIFFECAKRVYPFWLDEFPEDPYIAHVLHKINNYLYKGIDKDENGEEYNFHYMGEDYMAFFETTNIKANLAATTTLYTAFNIYTEAQGALDSTDYTNEDDGDWDSTMWLPDYYGNLTEVWQVEEPEQKELAYWIWFLDTVAGLVKDPEQPIIPLPSVPEEKEYPEETIERCQTNPLPPFVHQKLLSVWDQLTTHDLSEYDEVTIVAETAPWLEITVYLLQEGEVVESDYGEGSYIKDKSAFIDIKKKMYELAPHEGAWINCICTFSLKRRIITHLSFNYGEKETEEFEDLKEEKEFDYLKNQSADLVNEFQEYPRSRKYTPHWWQRWIAKSAYLPLPDTPQETTRIENPVRPKDDILSYAEELRNVIREHPRGKLPLAYRLKLYQQIGDPVKINRIFYECAQKVYPIWQKSFPKDRILPGLLIKAQEFLYPETADDRDVRWFLQNRQESYIEGETGAIRNTGYATVNLVTGIIMESENILKKEDYTGADDETFHPEHWLPDYCAYTAIVDNYTGNDTLPEEPAKNRQYWNELLDTVQAVLRNPGIPLSDTLRLPQPEPEKEPFNRRQGMFMNTRNKFLAIREAIIADLEINKMKGWHEALLVIDTIGQIRMGLTLIKLDGINPKNNLTEKQVLYAETFPNLFACIEKGLITDLKDAMYKEAPYEGAWCQCAVTCVLYERNVKEHFNYDGKEFYGRIVTPASVKKEFAKYPRSREFTPSWWQACLNINTNYLELPLKIKREKIDEIRRAYSNKTDSSTILGLYQAIADKNITLDNGDTLLHIAAEVADHQAIAYLLKAGIDPDVQNQTGETALHKLARLSPSTHIGATEITRSVEILLDEQASVLIRNKQDDTCYHLAARLENLLFIKVLVKKGAKLDIADKDGRNLLHLIPAEIMRRETDRLRYTTKEEDIQKIHCVVDEAYDICKLLLQYGLDPEKKDKRNQSPFDIAVEYNLKKLAVLYSGEDPDSPEGRLKAAAGGKTIHQAAATGDVEAIEALIELGSNPDEVYPEYEFKQMTPLAIAAIKGFKPCVEALLRKGADPHFRSGETGEGVLKFVIDNTKDKEYYAPHKMITATEIMQVFLDHGLDVNTFVDNDSNTILNYTCLKIHWNTRGRQQIRTLLLETKRCDMNIPDIHGRTPLMNFVQSEFPENPEVDLTAMLEQGASLTARDKDGNNPMMYAAANKSHLYAYNMGNIMLEFGYPPLDEVNNQGQTALDIAVEKGHEDLVKLLLNKM